MTMQTFTIHIESDNPEAEGIVREAARSIACEIDWGGECAGSITALNTFGKVPVVASGAEHLCSWAMEPGEEES